MMTVAAALCLMGCQQDAYDKGEGEYSLMRADLVTLHTDRDCYVDSVYHDDGYVLLANPQFTTQQLTTPDSLYRSLFYYELRADSTVRPISMTLIPTLRPKRAEQWKGGVPTDPVHFESGWTGRARRYLNCSVLLMTGQPETTDSVLKQKIGVALDSVSTSAASGITTAYLTFAHDQGGVPEYYSQRLRFSVPLSDLGADSVQLRIVTYGDTIVKTF